MNEQLEGKVANLSDVVKTSTKKVEEATNKIHESARKRNFRPTGGSGLVPSMIKVDAPGLEEKDKQLRALTRKLKQQK